MVQKYFSPPVLEGIMTLCQSRPDLKRRAGRIAAQFSRAGVPMDSHCQDGGPDPECYNDMLGLLLIHHTPAAIGRALFCYSYEILAPLNTSSQHAVNLLRRLVNLQVMLRVAAFFLPHSLFLFPRLLLPFRWRCCRVVLMFVWGCLRYYVGRHFVVLLFSLKKGAAQFSPNLISLELHSMYK
jgi:hypothetical protein